MTESIESLIKQCLKGDQAAWEAIVRQHRRKVFNVAYKFVGKYDEAEDLTQEIFLKIFKSLDTFDSRANFQTWLVSVSRNLCIDHYRSVRKERETRLLNSKSQTGCPSCSRRVFFPPRTLELASRRSCTIMMNFAGHG